MRAPRPGWVPLALLLGGAGTLHLLRPGPFAAIVPAALGRPYHWVYASGAAELACAAGLAAPRTRGVAGLATALLFVAVFPANVTMALDAVASPRASGTYRALAVARLPLQVPLVLWAADVGRRGQRGQRGLGRRGVQR